MVELLSRYSVVEVCAFIVTFALAVRGLVTYSDWAIDRVKKHFSKEVNSDRQKEELQRKIEENSKNIETIMDLQEGIAEQLSDVTDRLALLMESDKEDIKAFITREHRFFCYNQGWIDPYSLDCIERRYSHYVREGGNSFVKDLMTEIRALSKVAPGEEIRGGR